MKFNNLEKELKVFQKKMESDLKKLIKEEHYDTGALYRSINFKITVTDDEINLEFIANEYLEYLEGGNFIKRFLREKRDELPNVVRKSIIQDIINSI